MQTKKEVKLIEKKIFKKLTNTVCLKIKKFEIGQRSCKFEFDFWSIRTAESFGAFKHSIVVEVVSNEWWQFVAKERRSLETISEFPYFENGRVGNIVG